MKIQVKIFLLFYFLFLSCEKSEPKSILETRKGYLTGIGNSTTNYAEDRTNATLLQISNTTISATYGYETSFNELI